jgi:nucleotide-binding universal stress UspA family protein
MTVLAGYVPTQLGDAVVEHAAEEARRRRTDLVVFNAARGEAAIEGHRLSDERAAEIAAELAARGVDVRIERQVERGDPAHEILEAADRLDAEVIVIGLRHRSAVGKLILGSDAQRILLHATCPVLAVKAPH